jgi:subtilase family serine protease
MRGELSVTRSTCVQALIFLALLFVCVSQNAKAQGWAATKTAAFPLQNLPQPTLLGPLAASTSVHVVVGLQPQNASQFQPTLQAMLTPGNPLYGTSFTLQQFVDEFGATPAQVQAVENYLTSAGFTNITVADNQLLIDGYATAGQVESAFNTSLSEYSVNGTTVFVNTTAAEVPASLSGVAIAVLAPAVRGA